MLIPTFFLQVNRKCRTNPWHLKETERRMDAERKTYSVRFPLELIDSLLAGIQSLVQPTESLKITLPIPRTGRKPSHHSLKGRESLQTKHFEPREIPCPQRCYIASQPVSGLFLLAYHNGRPFSPVGIDELVGEPLLRETVHKPINCPLDVEDVLLGDLPLWVGITDNGHSQTLLSSLGITQLSSMSVPLRLPAVRSDARGSLVLAGTLEMITAFQTLGSRCTGTMILWSFTSLCVDLRCSGLLRSLSITALRRDPDLRGPAEFGHQ